MANIQEAAYLAVAFVIFVVTVAVSGSILAGVQDSQYNLSVTGCTLALARAGQANCTTVASNASNSGLSGISNLAAQAPVIGTILAAVVIIGLLMTAFMRRE